MKKLLSIFAVFALLGTNAYATCTINYACGTGASGTAPTSQSITDATAVFTPSAPTECTKDGSVFSHWVAVSSSKTVAADGAMVAGAEYTIPFIDNTGTCSSKSVTLTLTAQWVDATYTGVPTSKSYTDAQLNGRQPQFANLGNDKLMLYSDTTNGAVGGRDIVTTLGNSTTADSVPTRGAINTALATKQNTLNGTAGWVVENTGTAGSVKAKPVYSTTDNYKTALVEADDLNQIVIDAVNSELTAVEGVGWQINTVGNLTLPTLRRLMPDASINGSNYCVRKLRGSKDTDSTCSAATLSTLGASGNKSGLWGTVFSYGDIVGKSVCSATEGTSNTAATDAQESGLTTEFNNQTGVGESALSNTQMHCWCKMESIAGEPAVSRWVFRGSDSSASVCAGNCAYECGAGVRYYSDFRSGLFNSVQQ